MAILRYLRKNLRYYFNLSPDTAENEQIDANIRGGVEFKGTNLWVLIFAIFIASIGLNVNSTAVIIGAMLISPLMGPIMGVGYGMGIVDFELIRKSGKNLAVAVLFSLLTSAVYFFVTPLNDASSELLSRTSPAFWDVMIAFFGGLAGIVAVTRKEKSNVLPGVAIATALMPPLCTAGYGLATGNMYYFAGAFYLFFINSVFISFSTFLIVRYLKLPLREFVDAEKGKRMRRYVYLTVLVTLAPSLYLAKKLVEDSIFQRAAESFVNTELKFESSFVLRTNIDPHQRSIETVVVGKSLTDSVMQVLQSKLPNYHLENTNLVFVQQGLDGGEAETRSMRSAMLREIIAENRYLIDQKDAQILQLQNKIKAYERHQNTEASLAMEMKTLFPEIKSVVITDALSRRQDGVVDTFLLTVIESSRQLGDKSKNISEWLRIKTGVNNVKIIYQ
ncbi:MAG: TIGR00341 family protein [Saprospiraceae bacterium]|nr:TIGR00341 family protein [Saprospiraceae bacterium]